MEDNKFYQILQKMLTQMEVSTTRHKQIMNVEELVRYTGMSKSFIYKLCSSREIPHYKVRGRTVFFKKTEIDRYLLSNPVLTLDQLRRQHMGHKSAGHR